MGSGLHARPGGTLVDRAVAMLDASPARSREIAREVMGIRRAPAIVFDRLVTALLGPDPRIRRLPDGRWELVRTVGQSPPFRDCTFAVVDVETTGSRRADRITEVAVVTVHDRDVELAFDKLVNPERPISHAASRVTRISEKDVRDKPVFDEIVDDVLAALAGRVFVAHNMQFDWAFIATAVRRTRDYVLDGPQLCTVRLAKQLVPGLRSRSLDSLSRYFGIDIEHRHRAGSDALATAKILVRLFDLAEERGAQTLRDLESLSRRRAPKRRRKRRATPSTVAEI